MPPANTLFAQGPRFPPANRACLRQMDKNNAKLGVPNTMVNETS